MSRVAHVPPFPANDSVLPRPMRWWVYLCGDHKGNIIYAGRTGNLEPRMRQHASVDSAWWSEVAMIEYRLCSSEEDMKEAERRIICLYHPKFNRTFPSCKFCGVDGCGVR